MRTLDRRAFVHSTALAAGGCWTLTEWIASAFALQEPRSARDVRQRRPRPEFVLEAARRAYAESKPLLVLVAPRRTRDKAQRECNASRGWAFAAWASSDDPEALLDLGLFVPACGSAGDLRAAFGCEILEPEPILIWIDVLSIDAGELPRVRVRAIADERDTLQLFQERVRRGDAALRGRTRNWFGWQAEQIAGSLRAEIACRGTGVLDRLAVEVCARLDADSRAQLATWLAGASAAPRDMLFRATAELRCALRGLGDDQREARRRELSAAIGHELGSKRIPGSIWGRHAACGIAVDDPQAPQEHTLGAMACGIAQMPGPTRRFLFLYVPS